VLPVSEKSTVAEIGDPSLSVPVPLKIRSALAVPAKLIAKAAMAVILSPLTHKTL
jgi:hypothetical protein